MEPEMQNSKCRIPDKSQVPGDLKRLRALIDISTVINSSLDIAEIREKAMEAAARVTGSEAGSLLFVDEETGELYFDVAYGEKGKAVKPLRLKKGQGIAGWVAAERRPVIVNDVQNDARFFRNADERSGFVTRSMACTPVKIKGKLLGVLQAVNKKDGPYGQDDLELLGALSNQIAVAMENARLYQEQQDAFLDAVHSLAEAMEKKDRYTGGHTERVTNSSLAAGRVLGLSRAQMKHLRFAAILHDIGKIGIRDSVLLKDGELTGEEFEQIKKHPVFGAEILAHIKQLKEVLPGVRHHHEKVDGSGYPENLRADDIPLIARIIAVADAFDAITTDRPYRKGRSPEIALDELRRMSGSQFDPHVVEAFIRACKGDETRGGA